MKSEAEVQKILQAYVMKAKQLFREERDNLWRLQMARIGTVERILGYDYEAMLKIRRKTNHLKKVKNKIRD